MPLVIRPIVHLLPQEVTPPHTGWPYRLASELSMHLEQLGFVPWLKPEPPETPAFCALVLRGQSGPLATAHVLCASPFNVAAWRLGLHLCRALDRAGLTQEQHLTMEPHLGQQYGLSEHGSRLRLVVRLTLPTTPDSWHTTKLGRELVAALAHAFGLSAEEEIPLPLATPMEHPTTPQGPKAPHLSQASAPVPTPNLSSTAQPLGLPVVATTRPQPQHIMLNAMLEGNGVPFRRTGPAEAPLVPLLRPTTPVSGPRSLLPPADGSSSHVFP